MKLNHKSLMSGRNKTACCFFFFLCIGYIYTLSSIIMVWWKMAIRV